MSPGWNDRVDETLIACILLHSWLEVRVHNPGRAANSGLSGGTSAYPQQHASRCEFRANQPQLCRQRVAAAVRLL